MQGKILPSPKKHEKTETTSNIKALDFIHTKGFKGRHRPNVQLALSSNRKQAHERCYVTSQTYNQGLISWYVTQGTSQTYNQGLMWRHFLGILAGFGIMWRLLSLLHIQDLQAINQSKMGLPRLLQTCTSCLMQKQTKIHWQYMNKGYRYCMSTCTARLQLWCSGAAATPRDNVDQCYCLFFNPHS